VYLKVAGQFVESLDAFDGLDGHFGFECSAVLFALLLHYWVTGYIMVSYQSPSKLRPQYNPFGGRVWTRKLNSLWTGRTGGNPIGANISIANRVLARHQAQYSRSI
jgi:hypothetical protein